MRNFRKRLFLVQVLLVLICLILCLTTFAGPNGKAKGHDKVAPGLARLLEIYEASQDMELPVIVQVDPDSFHPHGAPPGLLQAKAVGLVHGFAGKMKVSGIRGLENNPWVDYVTVDATIQPTGDQILTTTVGVDQLQPPLIVGANTGPAYNGSGVVIAVFDSGVDATHHDFRIRYANRPTSRVVDQVDFTSGTLKTNVRGDDYGHGTHVAGVVGGNGEVSAEAIEGIAPSSRILSVKVLDEQGNGLTSDVINAIDWVIQNKDEYGVDVANLSLGHPAFESYQTDPLCQAVRRLVEAGIVTVVSAGNLGKTPNHPEIWGGITSPGTEPSVITVGAANTQGTLTHEDDEVASFSSRGYTLPDGLFKPDLVAPGNHIPATKADSSYLDESYPQLSVDADYMSLSGTSMATAFVSGAVAMLLDANENLTPNLVKTILLSTATKMNGSHMLEQGNGFLNVYPAVKLALEVDVANQRLIGPVDPMWTLEGENGPEQVWVGGAFVYGDRVLYTDLVNSTGGFWGNSVVWSDNLFGIDSVLWADSLFGPESVIWSDFFDSLIWADTQLWTDSVVWSDTSLWFDSVIWADFFDSVIWADFFSEGVIWADSVIWSEGPGDSASVYVGDEEAGTGDSGDSGDSSDSEDPPTKGKGKK